MNLIWYKAKWTVFRKNVLVWLDRKRNEWYDEIEFQMKNMIFTWVFHQNWSNWITLWIVIIVEWSSDRHIHTNTHACTHTRSQPGAEFQKLEIRAVVSQTYYVVHSYTHAYTLNAMYSIHIDVVLQVTLCIVRSKYGYVLVSLHLAHSFSLQSSTTRRSISLSQHVWLYAWWDCLYAHEFVVFCVYAESKRPQRHTRIHTHTAHIHTGIEKVTLFFPQQPNNRRHFTATSHQPVHSFCDDESTG